MKKKYVHRLRRHRRVRAKVTGTSERPRVVVFKSNRHMYVQAVNDEVHQTVASVGDRMVKVAADAPVKGTKERHAFAVGKALAEQLKKQKVTAVVFDAGGFLYHGRVKAIADGLRSGGIIV